MTLATARHILVDTEEQCNELKEQIANGADFAELAKEHSNCPSGRSGGDLGQFGPGMMVPEFDKVVFSAEVGSVEGPVKTQFGYHLLQVTSRS
ncbi:peptidylprolyl isomerase [Thiomicrorhabdus sp.]|uniref:peptidylprolyl isomerase n=1 Tax=Thiomicrorhabdus sp. TaxID=2039724 RepID=UPI0035645B56